MATRAWQNRVDNGLPHHGMGKDEFFPGNVSHLVSPVVGILRRIQAGQTELTEDRLEYFIDRLSFVLELAREEAENSERS